MITLLPRRVDLVVTPGGLITPRRRAAIWCGATYEDEDQILDANGDPVRLGLDANTPWWDFRAKVYTDRVQAGGIELCSFDLSILDYLAGTLRRLLVPSATAEILQDDLAWWELDLTNTDHPDYDPGFTATPRFGSVLFLGQYAEA